MDLVVPKVGLTIEEAEVVEWLVAAGDEVRAGQPVVVLNADKTELEIEAPADGVLVPLVGPGDVVAVGGVLGSVRPAGAPHAAPDPIAVEAPVPATVASAAAAAVLEVVPVAPTTRRRSRRASSPRARAVARSLGVDLGAVTGSGPGGRIVERDVRAAGARPPAPAAMPVTAVATVRADRLLQDQRRRRAAGEPVALADLVVHALGHAVADVLGRSGAIAVARRPPDGGGWSIVDVGDAASATARARRAADAGPASASVSGAVASVVDGSEDAVDELVVPPVIGCPIAAGIGSVAERPVVVAGQLDVRATVTIALAADPVSVTAAELVELAGRLVVALEHDVAD